MKDRYGKTEFTLMLLAVIALVIMGGLYAYMHRSTLKLVDRALEAENKVTSEEVSLADSRRQLAFFEATVSERSKLSDFFVRADDAVAFIQAVESIGDTTGASMTISSISADNIEQSAPGTMGKIVARVTMSGSWQQAMRALELAEALPYRSRVDKVVLATSVIAGSSSAWQLNFEISALSLVSSPL